ncbi:MAG TPA: MobF family relaxase [Terriglobales bacterium]
MITISKPLSSGQAQAYHREEFGNGRENYYSEGERIQGEWHGKLAAQWDLGGKVKEEEFARLAEGQHPKTGEQLVRHQVVREYATQRGEKVRTMEHRAGWDATFSAPKSVSLTALVGGDEHVREAHRQSVRVALDEMERYVQARIGSNHPAETTGQWVAAKFEHDSARPVEGYAAPQLHTHVVFFNLTETEDGKAHAIQPQELYRTQQYATAVYRSELAGRLRELGYEIEAGKSGQPEIKGYTQEYLEASSPRRQQIEQHLEEQGLRGAGAAQIAAHRTREAKLELSPDEVRQQHREMAEAFGNQAEHVVSQAQELHARPKEPRQEQKAKAIEAALTYSRERNIEREAVADERALMRDALKRSMGEASLADVRSRFEQHVEQGKLIQVEQQKPNSAGRGFTTAEMIGYERDIVEQMRAGQSQHEALVSFATRREIEQEHPHLSSSQRAAVEQILSSRDQMTALEGKAGAGKTTSLAAIREAAEHEGYAVEGLAPTSRAAQILREAGIESGTLQRHLVPGDQTDDGQKRLYILDESSLASTKQMNEFLHGLHGNDRVLLVGDVRQHEAVEAGRPYHQLQEAGLQTARLDEILRQKDPALKEAVEQLARGEVRGAIHNLDRQGRVHEIADRAERLKTIAHEYVTHPEGTLVVSPDNRSRQEINQFIHSEMQLRGHVDKTEHRIKVLLPRQEMTGADRQWAGQYEAGDVVRYSKGSQVLGIEGGEYARVRHVDQKQNLITVKRPSGERQTYDPRRLHGVTLYREAERAFAEGDRVQFTAPYRQQQFANRELGTIEKIDDSGQAKIHLDSGRRVEFDLKNHPHLDYGYAVTSHSSQGQTADRVLIHVDSDQAHPNLINSRMAYVSVSRARYDAQIYTNDETNLAQQLSRDVSHRSAMEPNGPSEPVHKINQTSMQSRADGKAPAHGMGR